MMMKKNVVITTVFNLDELINTDWLYYCPDENTCDPIARNPEVAAKHFGVSRELLEAIDDALRTMANALIEKIELDLEDLSTDPHTEMEP